MGQNQINIALLGLGRIGQMHALNLINHPEFNLKYTFDIDKNLNKKLGKKYKSIPINNPNVAFNDRSIKCIFIATSTKTHLNYIDKAVRNKKVVFCEKPLDLSLKKIDKYKKKLSKFRPKIQIGFNRRYDPGHNSLKKNLVNGKIGKLEKIIITSRDPAPPSAVYLKNSGGIFKDMMIHDFDMANFLYGELPKSISVSASAIIDKKIGALGDYDTAVATLKYRDGRLAVIKNSRRATYGYDQRIEVLGSKGLLQVQNMVENCMVKSTEMGVESSKPEYFFLERYKSAYQNEWAAFVTAVKTETPMPVSLSDGIAALALAEAAATSAEMGSEVEIANFL